MLLPEMPHATPPDRFTVAALYQFRSVPDPAALRADLLSLGHRAGLCGTLILAPEGLNGTVAGSAEAVGELRHFLRTAGFDRLEDKESTSPRRPFRRFKVRLKQEIVTLGVAVEPRERVGTYLSPAQWNGLLADPDVVVVDTRNRYEVSAGTFRGALNPQIDSFREFPAWLEAHRAELEGKRVAMFCTGGVRCEKSTSLLLQLGFQDVYHLQGGILKYLEDVPEEHSRWNGECFVFDERVTVGHGLRPGTAVTCHSCGWPLGPGERAHRHYEEGVSCPHCHAHTSADQKASFRDRQRFYDRAGA